MSSTIDQVECPVCGNFAQQETDNKTGDSWIVCQCGYDSSTEEGD